MIDIDLMVFDVDGTLIDSRKDIVNSVNFTLDKLGLSEKSFDTIVSYIGTGARNLLKKSLGVGNINLLERGLSIFSEHFVKHCADNSRLYPHVKETLEYFRHKFKAVITNRKKDSAALSLKLFGIDKYFEEIIGGDDYCLKPDACPLNIVLNQFKVEKNRTIMIGDMDLDIIAGKNAGVLTCGVTYGIGKKEDILKARPDFIISDLIELIEKVN